MSRFIELKFSNNNQPVLINTASIMSVSANGTGTKMLLQGGYTVTVIESFQQIKKKLKSYGTTI